MTQFGLGEIETHFGLKLNFAYNIIITIKVLIKPFQKGVSEGNDPSSDGSFLLAHFISEMF